MRRCCRVGETVFRADNAGNPPTRPSGLNRKGGQALTEYVVIAAIIAIGVVVTVSLFGEATLGVLSQLGTTMKRDGEAPDKTALDEATAAMEVDAGVTRNMRNFDLADGGSSQPDTSPGTPQQQPSPSPSQEYAGIHHLGNSGTNPNGNVINEGLNYRIAFTLTPEMIAYANYADGGALFLSFSAGDRAGDYNNFIDNEGVNAILLDGQVAGYAANGQNSIALNIGNLSPGQHTVTFTSGDLATTPDDFNISDIAVGHAGQ
ncbi:MAG: hypothetical protein WCL44_01335 [bacterium]